MELLPQSVEEYLETIPKGEARDQVLVRLFVEMVESIEQVHKMGYLHRDVKPSNFRIKNGHIYITDFGLVFEYMQRDGRGHIAETFGNMFKGTLHFSSIRGHQKCNQGRRDDLETLAYVMLYYLNDCQNYDWMKNDKFERYVSQATQNEYIAAKEEFVYRKDSPRLYAVQQFAQRAISLQFAEEPNYEEFKNIARDLFIGYD